MERLARKAPSLSMIPKKGAKPEHDPQDPHWEKGRASSYKLSLTTHALWHDCTHIYIDEHNKQEHKINSQLSSWRGSVKFKYQLCSQLPLQKVG